MMNIQSAMNGSQVGRCTKHVRRPQPLRVRASVLCIVVLTAAAVLAQSAAAQSNASTSDPSSTPAQHSNDTSSPWAPSSTPAQHSNDTSSPWAPSSTPAQHGNDTSSPWAPSSTPAQHGNDTWAPWAPSSTPASSGTTSPSCTPAVPATCVIPSFADPGNILLDLEVRNDDDVDAVLEAVSTGTCVPMQALFVTESQSSGEKFTLRISCTPQYPCNGPAVAALILCALSSGSSGPLQNLRDVLSAQGGIVGAQAAAGSLNPSSPAAELTTREKTIIGACVAGGGALLAIIIVLVVIIVRSRRSYRGGFIAADGSVQEIPAVGHIEMGMPVTGQPVNAAEYSTVSPFPKKSAWEAEESTGGTLSTSWREPTGDAAVRLP